MVNLFILIEGLPAGYKLIIQWEHSLTIFKISTNPHRFNNGKSFRMIGSESPPLNWYKILNSAALSSNAFV